MSAKEYLKLEETSQIRHEYVGGMIHAHADGTSRHNVIANILASLCNAARGGPCRVYGSDMLLRASEVVFCYPDVMVVCGDEGAGDEALYQVAPCLVVEVTSPTTEATDRREKMLAYRYIPSPQAYIIAAQEDLRVERHWRDQRGGGSRPRRSVPRASCPSVPCPEIELMLAQIYEGPQEPA